MLTVEIDKVCYIVSLARQFDADMPEDDEDPGSDLGGEEFDEIDEDSEIHEESLLEDEIHEFVNRLNEDEAAEIVALAWVGRGSYGRDEWEQAMEEARRNANERTAEYLMGMPLLADYLEEGLAAFDLSCGG
ncbi:MAG: DUF3775 domain-containing protein [Geminicoccaceae bacterium]|nr:DUF3775 domain-containing protein [Geminicoccaceae bacterium]